MNFSTLKRRWRALFHKDQVEQELDDELQYHLERDIAENIKSGMSPDEARSSALRAFGSLAVSKEESRDARGVRWIENILQDLRYSGRLLLKNPVFTFVVVLTLALGISANTAIFSFANGILLRPLPYPDSDRLSVIDETALKRGINSMSVSYPNFLDWRERNTVFEGIGLHYGSNRFALSGTGQAEEIRGSYITYGLLEVLRVPPILGRTFTKAEDKPDTDDVVILGHDLWQRRFGGDPKIIGQRITLNNYSRTVIGVMPPGFKFPAVSELWAPLAVTPQTFTRNDHTFTAMARLKDGVTFEQAQAEMDRITAQIELENPVTNEGLGVAITSLHKSLTGDYRQALFILLGVVGCVLLVACVNVANLMLARASSRQKEVTLRAALGASRWRIIQQLLIESLLLAAVGGILGLFLSVWALRLLLSSIPINLPFWMNFGIDFRVLAFTAGVTILTGLIFGAIPALQTSRVNLNDTLKEGGRGSLTSARNFSRSVLVVAEIALSLILLVGAGLMIQSFLRLRSVDVGLNPKGVATASVNLPRLKYPEGPQRAAFFKQLLERASALPGVESAAGTTTLPLSGGGWGRSLTVEGHPVLSVSQAPMIQHTVVTPNYFRTMGITLLSGRDFTATDVAGAPLVTIIDERLAREYWPNDSPIGKRVRFGPPEDNEPWQTVIGVVRSVRHERMQEDTRKSVYLAHPQVPVNGMAVVMRTSGDPRNLAPAIRREVTQMDPDIPVNKTPTMEEVIAESVWQPRLYTTLFTVFGVGALILALIGIYGVMAYLVVTRTHEIGVRMALGATSRNIFGLIVGRGMKLTFIGVLLGILGAYGLTRLIRGLLFNVSTTDPVTFTSISLLLVLVAFVACYIPARRAMKVNPLVALRYE